MADDRIEGLRIASPCSVSWEGMDGDARVRHCAVCSLNVYNLSEMTREEVRTLLARSEGRRVCGRLYRRADGTVLTGDCPTGLRALRRRASRIAAAAVSALLSLPSFAFGAPPSKKPPLSTHEASVQLTREQAATSQRATFTGVVVMNGDPIPGVTVALRDETSTRTVTSVTDAKGGFMFPLLSDGVYRVDMTLEGLLPASIEHLELQSAVVTHATISLRLIPEMGIIVAEPETVRHDPLSTTFTQNFIDKLPM